MYKAIFKNDNGKSFDFSLDNNIICDIELAKGVSVDLGTSQGFDQVGVTVERRSVTGRQIPISGKITDDIVRVKNEMRHVLAPFNTGTLIFGDYSIRVEVKDTPTFAEEKSEGKFSLLLFAPYPYFKKLNAKIDAIGKIVPKFKFPVNYEQPHIFGVKSEAKYTNVYNDGDVEVPFNVLIHCLSNVSGITLTNLQTFKKIVINGDFLINDFIYLYRDNQNVLKAELRREEQVVDILSNIDESTNLYSLSVGDNLIGASDNKGGSSLEVSFEFKPAVVIVYEY